MDKRVDIYSRFIGKNDNRKDSVISQKQESLFGRLVSQWIMIHLFDSVAFALVLDVQVK